MSSEKAIARSTEKIDKIDSSAAVEEKYADVTLKFLEEHGDSVPLLTPEAEKKLRRKLYWRLMMLLSAINIVLFVSIMCHQPRLTPPD